MLYNFSGFITKSKSIENWLINEYQNIRTGRASTAFLDQVKVESYGEMVPLSNVASIGIEDAKCIRVSPWDSSLIKSIEKAVIVADLGVSTAVDERGLRIIFPDLTGERRTQLIKIAKEKLEDAKVALRQERNTINDDMNKQKKEGDMSEDEVLRSKKEFDKHIETASATLDTSYLKKEKEITI
jgi:ribosome recycling factor